MKRLYYQFKNIRRDKMCILSFLLPVLVGAAISLLSDVDFSAAGETAFGIVEDDLTAEMKSWLEQNGQITIYRGKDELVLAVNDPAGQMIGVLREGDSIRTIVSGDELKLYRTIGDALPNLYVRRETTAGAAVEIHPLDGNSELLKPLLIAITLVTAMFMGCTYNAMNIIGEKEDGIACINQIMPMTKRQYMQQKIMLGLIAGSLSTAITALICIRITISYVPLLLLFILLSTVISALTGLFIGKIAGGLMVGVVYIKLIMILFIAPPILFYLIVPAESFGRVLSYLLPSSATFYGLMDILNGQIEKFGVYLSVLAGHCLVWFLFYFAIHEK